MFKTRNKSCAGRYRFGHPRPKTKAPAAVAWACSDVTKRHYRGRCTACFKGVLKHRPRSGVGRIMAWAGAWVSSASGQAKASQQASNPPGHRWRRAPAALDHATGQAWPPAAAPGQQVSRPDSSAAKGGAMGEPFSRPFPGLSVASRGRATPGTRQRTPGPGSVRPPTKAGAKGIGQGKAWGKNERLKGLNVCE